jgi:hypothetical protein
VTLLNARRDNSTESSKSKLGTRVFGAAPWYVVYVEAATCSHSTFPSHSLLALVSGGCRRVVVISIGLQVRSTLGLRLRYILVPRDGCSLQLRTPHKSSSFPISEPLDARRLNSDYIHGLPFPSLKSQPRTTPRRLSHLWVLTLFASESIHR